MRERSSVERMRMALTEKRDILGDMVAMGRGSSVKRRGEERGRKKGGDGKRREEKGGEGRRGEGRGEERKEARGEETGEERD